MIPNFPHHQSRVQISYNLEEFISQKMRNTVSPNISSILTQVYFLLSFNSFLLTAFLSG